MMHSKLPLILRLHSPNAVHIRCPARSHLGCLLDEAYWQLGWQPAAPDEFRTSVKAAMEKNEKGWVIDGEYSQAHGDMILREATDIICKYHCRLTVV